MNQLTIEELSVYLPYKLKMKSNDGIGTLIGLSPILGDNISHVKLHFGANTNRKKFDISVNNSGYNKCTNYGFYYLGNCKLIEINGKNEIDLSKHSAIPLLRPLSQLTTEIEVNGETFVPIEKLREWFTNIYFESGNYNKLNIKGKNETFISNDYFYLVSQHLLQWHFDIFGLLDRNLAEPIV